LSFTTFTLKLLKTVFIFAKNDKRLLEKQRGQTRLNDELFDILFHRDLNCPFSEVSVVVQEHSTRGFSDLFLIFNLTEQ